MKKRVISLLLVFTLVLAMIPAIAPVVAKAEGTTPEIAKANLVLNSILGVNFKINYNGTDPSGYSLRVTIGEDTNYQEITQYTEEDGLHVYTATLFAHRMHEEVTAQLFKDGIPITSEKWSFASYADELQEKYAHITELVTLTDTLGDYGAYAAYYAGKQSDPGTFDESGIEKAELDTYQHTKEGDMKISAYLYLDEACDLAFRFNTTDLEGKTLYVDGEAVETTPVSDTRAEYRINDILPQNWDTMHTIVVKESDTAVVSMTYGVLSYARQIMNLDTESKAGLNGLLWNMYQYNAAAKEYNGVVTGTNSKYVDFTGCRWSRAIYLSGTTPRLDMNLFVELGAENNTTVASGVTVYVNGKPYTVDLLYLVEASSNKGYIQFSATNLKCWTPVKGDDNYASDPAVTFDVLIPAGTVMNGKVLKNATRYLVNKTEGLDASGANPQQDCTKTTEQADADEYKFYTNLTSFRWGRAIYVNKTTPQLDLTLWPDAQICDTAGEVAASNAIIYVNGYPHTVNMISRLDGTKEYIEISIPNPEGWTPTEGNDNFASDPEVTFDVLIPAGIVFSNGTQTEKAYRYTATKSVGLDASTSHPRKELSCELTNADEYQYEVLLQDIHITGIREESRAIYVDTTTPRVDLEFYVDTVAPNAAGTTVDNVPMYLNGKEYAVTLTYLLEGNDKAYIQISLENPRGWTPVEGGDNYATDPAATFDVLLNGGVQFENGMKLVDDTRYIFTKTEGLEAYNTHMQKYLTATVADPAAYELVSFVNITGVRYGRAILVNMATPRLDFDLFVDASLSDISETPLTLYINGKPYTTTATYNDGGWISFSIEYPYGWNPSATDYTNDPATTFDLLIPGDTQMGSYVLDSAQRLILTKDAGLYVYNTVHVQQDLTATVGDPETYVYLDKAHITGYRGGSRAIFINKTTPRLDLEFWIDTELSGTAGTTVAEDVTVYVNGQAHTVDLVYQLESETKAYLQVSVENPIGWTPTEGGDDYASDPAATFDVLIPAGIEFINGEKLETSARYVFTKTVGLSQNDTHPRKALTAEAADAADYEIVTYMNISGFRYARAIYINETTPQLDVEFFTDAVLANTTGTEATLYKVATGVTVFINGKQRTVDINFNSDTNVIAFSVVYPAGWTPVEGDDDYASDPAATFDVLIPAGVKFDDGHKLEKSVRYIITKSEGLSQNDTHPRKVCTAEVASVEDYEYQNHVNVTGFRYGRAIYVNKATPRLDLEFFTSAALENIEGDSTSPYVVASGVTVYVNQVAYTVDISYNSTTGAIAFSVSNPTGWTPTAGDNNDYASDPAVTFDVLIPAGILFEDGTALETDVRYLVSKTEGLVVNDSHMEKVCSATAVDAGDYFVNYANVTGFRYARAIYMNKETPKLDLEFFMDVILENPSGSTDIPYPTGSNITVYVNGTAYQVDVNYNLNTYVMCFSVLNPSGWTPTEGTDNYASDPAVTFEVVIPAGTTFADGHVLKADACYAVTKPVGLDASTAHPRVECTAEEIHYIVSRGNTEYVIVYPASCTSADSIAVEELQYRFQEATDIELVAYKDNQAIPAGKKIISIGDTTYAQSTLGVTGDSVGLEGYKISTNDQNIYIIGAGNGVVGGTYKLLNKMFDYEFYKAGVIAGTDNDAADIYTLNTGVTDLKFITINETQCPDIPYMPTNYHGLREEDYYRYTFNNEGTLVAGTSSDRWHNTFLALDPATYQDAHADWYYTVTTGILWWKDTNVWQLCYTAHGDEDERQAMISTAVDYYVALLQEYPTRSYVSFSMEDNTEWCNCSSCNAAASTYGANSGAMLIMASEIRTGIMNKLADDGDTRDIKVLTMIYRSCEDLPAVGSTFDADFIADVDAEGLEGVVPIWATMDSKEHDTGWNEAGNETALAMLEQLDALFDEYWVWDYGVNFHDYLLPFNSFDTISEDFQTLRDSNVRLYLYQADHDAGNSTGFGGLRTYLMSKLRWDADADVDELTVNYFNAVYGAGGESMKALYDSYLVLAELNIAADWDQSIYSDTLLDSEYWPSATLEIWLTYIEEAKTAIAPLQETDPELYQVYLDNIIVESISVRYIYAMCYPSKVDTAFKQALYDDAVKYFVRVGENSSRDVTTLKDKLGLS